MNSNNTTEAEHAKIKVLETKFFDSTLIDLRHNNTYAEKLERIIEYVNSIGPHLELALSKVTSDTSLEKLHTALCNSDHFEVRGFRQNTHRILQERALIDSRVQLALKKVRK